MNCDYHPILEHGCHNNAGFKSIYHIEFAEHMNSVL